MKGNRYLFYFLIIMIGLMAPLSYLKAVNTQKGGHERTEKMRVDKPENQKLDVLSLIAHIAMTLGIASLFVVPELSLVFIPAAFIMGLIAWKNRRYDHKRGKGLALSALILGGVFTTMVAISFLIYALEGV